MVLPHKQNLWSVFLSYPPSHTSFSVTHPIFLSSTPLHCYPLYSWSFLLLSSFPSPSFFHQLIVIRAWRGGGCSFSPVEFVQFPQCLLVLCMGSHQVEWNWFQRVKFSHKPFLIASQIPGRSLVSSQSLARLSGANQKWCWLFFWWCWVFFWWVVQMRHWTQNSCAVVYRWWFSIIGVPVSQAHH